jgi:uncharacterized protein
VKVLFRRDADLEARGGDGDPLDDVELGAHDGDTVELDPVLRELIILGVPMSPRCKESCRGLCPVCGQSRNDLDCGHEQTEKLSALGAQLKDLKLS